MEESIKEGVRQGIYGLGEVKDNKQIPVYWKKEPSVGFSDTEMLIDAAICQKELGAAREEVQPEEQVIKTETIIDRTSKKELISSLELPLMPIPKGKVAQILGLLNYIQTKFNNVEIKITASDGAIEKDDYENKIKEALKQMGIDLD